jgi:hypothetical protein
VTAAAFAYLWQADGALAGGRGVSGEAWSARMAAEGCLRGGASSAVVEQATPALGVNSLDGAWCRTGQAWQAERVPGGGIRWVPVAAQAERGAG